MDNRAFDFLIDRQVKPQSLACRFSSSAPLTEQSFGDCLWHQQTTFLRSDAPLPHTSLTSINNSSGGSQPHRLMKFLSAVRSLPTNGRNKTTKAPPYLWALFLRAAPCLCAWRSLVDSVCVRRSLHFLRHALVPLSSDSMMLVGEFLATFTTLAKNTIRSIIHETVTLFPSVYTIRTCLL